MYEFAGPDWVSVHTDNWLDWFRGYPNRESVRFLEIGSHEGRSAVWWLKHVIPDHPDSRLYCVDKWERPEPERFFDRNILASGRSHQVVKIKSRSERAIGPIMNAGLFDAAYIDGSHEARDVLLDGLIVMQCMKPGGVIVFDDYEWAPESYSGIPPKPAIDAFLEVCQQQVDVIHHGYQVAVRVI